MWATPRLMYVTRIHFKGHFKDQQDHLFKLFNNLKHVNET